MTVQNPSRLAKTKWQEVRSIWNHQRKTGEWGKNTAFQVIFKWWLHTFLCIPVRSPKSSRDISWRRRNDTAKRMKSRTEFSDRQDKLQAQSPQLIPAKISYAYMPTSYPYIAQGQIPEPKTAHFVVVVQSFWTKLIPRMQEECSYLVTNEGWGKLHMDCLRVYPCGNGLIDLLLSPPRTSG